MLGSARTDEGFTLVELLVAMSLIIVTSVVALTGLVQSMRTTTQTEGRIEAFNELQIAMERVARELRAADPVLVGYTADRVSVLTFRGGTNACNRYTIRVAGGALLMDRETSNNNCVNFGALSTQTLVRNVRGGSSAAPGAVVDFQAGTAAFTYATRNGQAPAEPEDIAAIRFTLQRDLPQQDPVTVSTVVNVRNTR